MAADLLHLNLLSSIAIMQHQRSPILEGDIGGDMMGQLLEDIGDQANAALSYRMLQCGLNNGFLPITAPDISFRIIISHANISERLLTGQVESALLERISFIFE